MKKNTVMKLVSGILAGMVVVLAATNPAYSFGTEQTYIVRTDSDIQNEMFFPSEEIEVLSEQNHIYKLTGERLLEKILQNKKIEWIEEDGIVSLENAEYEVVDTYQSSQQYYLSQESGLGVFPMWEEGLYDEDKDDRVDRNHDGDATNDELIIAIIDSGMSIATDNLDTERLLAGWNVIEENTNVEDELWHGTFIGSMFLAKDNVDMPKGLLKKVKIYPIKAFTNTSSNYSSIIKAISHAVDQKKKFEETGGKEGVDISVINMSFTAVSQSEGLREVCTSAMEAGILLVCAGGNNGRDTQGYPAQYSMGVGSIGKDGVVSSFSGKLPPDKYEGYANKIWVMAPGEKILGYDAQGNMVLANGTSFSAPFVSGLAAILKGLDNELTQTEFMNILKQSVGWKPKENEQDFEYGWGNVNFYDAYKYTMKKIQMEMNSSSQEREEDIAPSVIEREEKSDVEPEKSLKVGDILNYKDVYGNTWVFRVTRKTDVSKKKKGTVCCQRVQLKKKNLTIPNQVILNNQTFQVTSIAKNVLRNNKKITKLIIGKNVQRVGKNAFSGCSKLKYVIIKGKKIILEKGCLSKIAKNATINVENKQLKKQLKI